MKKRGIAIAILVMALAGAAWATGAVSSIVAPNGTINGCYKAQGGAADPNKGQLRVVAAGEQCKPNELAIQWNQLGPKGDQGSQGLQGPVGPQGPKGDTGDTGAQGIQGAAGPNGDQGPAGPKGELGAQGPAGPTGPAGQDGATGPAGPAGPVGAPGPAGPQGPSGPKGDEGLRWRGAWDAQQSYGSGEVVSYGGASWVARPATENGTTAGHAPPDNLNEWSLVADRGAQGPQGDKGDTGTQGPAGTGGASAGFEVRRDPASLGPSNGVQLIDSNLGETTVAHLALPAGKFIVIAKARFWNWNNALIGDNSRPLNCRLVPDGTSVTSDQGSTRIDGLATEMMNLQSAYDSGTAAGGIELRCSIGVVQTPSQVFVGRVRIDAVQVSTLTLTTQP